MPCFARPINDSIALSSFILACVFEFMQFNLFVTCLLTRLLLTRVVSRISHLRLLWRHLWRDDTESRLSGLLESGVREFRSETPQHRHMALHEGSKNKPRE